jgi:hypothetical protein
VAPASASGRSGAGRAPLGSGGKAGGTTSSSPNTRAAGAGRPAAPAARHDASDLLGPGAVASLIPVSGARAVRDAVAAASSARQSGANDPLRVARRVAAALNASDSPRKGDFGFFWITAVTADGKIVVANSYGLAYIPEGVQLPDMVHMASADDEIPAADRARCATYPVMAVQGWAAHHGTKLRAVIGTQQQLANSDPGAAKIVLEADDIPESGQMAGQSRLAAVDSEAADRLADTKDQQLLDLLPPAPVDENPPEDDPMMWFEVMKFMTSNAAGREAPHLRAFHAYATHCRELALHQAYSAADPETQRPAVEDWLYWQYVAGLLDSALSDAP